MNDGVYLATKKQVRQCILLKEARDYEPDLLLFKRRSDHQSCYVIELKDGHVFDTKKSAAEAYRLHRFIEKAGYKIPYTLHGFICCFNQNVKEDIAKGLKSKFSLEQIITGAELCKLLEINYQEIVNERAEHQSKNVTYFLKELIKIDEIKRRLKALLDESG